MTDTAPSPTSAQQIDVVDVSDGILTIAVSTAAAGNSLSDEALVQGAAELRAVARGEREVGAILLVGTGANFCAGGNVRAFASAEHRPTYLRGLADTFHAFVTALIEADRPVVAAVKGWAAGAGMSIVLHADVAIGGPSTKLRPAYQGIGLSPDGGLTWSLPRVVGTARARRILLTDEILDAETALALGVLGDTVADDAQVEEAARAAARKLAAGPRNALSATRALLSASPTNGLADQLVAEARSIARLSGRAEGIEGVDAFIGKRRPDFGAARTTD
ncbi:enoyl-CoA hydratase/isomerase family protein [Gordonia soli]|uniref:Putative enoyl-CoA hydratase n=1 Tax=Gordonia soli NBRC 108243 TaxID=1223545 RepID=M0QCL6_9ACTN|nr:enoyl-CoA hydratase-related protein [Gordonia soli]GAC66305.1 putative enoyl-CoA hydratase [Gordonia soli NBRC 108243]